MNSSVKSEKVLTYYNTNLTSYKLFVKSLLKNSYFENAFWSVLGSIVSRGSNFFAIAYIAKILGPNIFGEYNVIQTTVGLFGTVSGLGLGLAATKLTAEWSKKDQKKIGEIIGNLYLLSFGISITVSVIFFTISKWISINLLNNYELSLLLQITSVIIIFDAINGVQNGLLAGFEAFKPITTINFVMGLIGAPLICLGTYICGITGLILMLLASRIIAVAVTRFYLKSLLKVNTIEVRAKISKNQLKPIFEISVPSFLSSMTTSPVNWLTTSIFVNQLYGYKNLGIYNAANQLSQLVLFLPDSAGKVAIPRMAKAFGNNDSKEFRKTIVITISLNLLLSTLTGLFVFAFSFLFKDLIGAEYKFGNDLIIIVVINGILTALTNAIGYIFLCSNLIWYDFALRILWGLSLIGLMFFYGKNYGYVGYGYSILGSLVIHLVSHLFVLLKRYYSGKILMSESLKIV